MSGLPYLDADELRAAHRAISSHALSRVFAWTEHLARSAALREEVELCQRELRVHFDAEGTQRIVARVLAEAQTTPGESDVLGRLREILAEANARVAAVAPQVCADFAELATLATARTNGTVTPPPPSRPPPRNRAERRAAARAARKG
jgi:hypothetical protein